jgi:anti-sigma factor RsiW
MSHHDAGDLQDAVDGRLDATARAKLEIHLVACAPCRTAYGRLRWVKSLVAAVGAPEEPPQRLRASIALALDEEDRATAARAARSWMGSRSVHARTLVVAAAALVVVTTVALLVPRHPRGPVVVAGLAATFDRYRAGERPLEATTSQPERLRAFFAAKALGFEVRVLDLGMMGYQLVGGGVDVVDGYRTALLVYRADSGQVVLCAMLLGRAAELGGGAAAVRRHDGIAFHVHRLGRLTVVLWQEGATACALVSDGDPEELVRLAYAKAMHAPEHASVGPFRQDGRLASGAGMRAADPLELRRVRS